MKRIIITKTQVWDEEMPDVGVSVEEFVDQVLADSSPDFDQMEVEVLDRG
jgi:hypothetical protein